jgi:aminoethylphosphonate catabolism LysR family transcriptional regulator
VKINFQQLRCFHAVAQHGSFSAAARALLIGQPSITTHVKSLEQRFGVELFCRHGHNVKLTDVGERLLLITQRIFSLEGEAEDTLRAAGGLLLGQLRIGAISAEQVTNLVVDYGQRHPEVKLQVSLGNTSALVTGLLTFDNDVVIVPRQEDRRFHAVPYARTNLVLIVPRTHRWSQRRSVKLAELEGQRMVLREVGSATRKVFEEILAAANVKIRPALEIESREAVRESVAVGIGIGIALDSETHFDGRLHTLDIADAPVHLQLDAVCLSERREAPLIKAFLDIVRASHTAKTESNSAPAAKGRAVSAGALRKSR